MVCAKCTPQWFPTQHSLQPCVQTKRDETKVGAAADMAARLCCNPCRDGKSWHHVADKSHSSCQPKGTGDILLLNQQLWQNISLQMSLVHPHLQPKAPCLQGTATPHPACALCFTDYIFQSKAKDFYTSQKQRYVWLVSLRLYLKGKK